MADDFGPIINPMRKLVISRTLTKPLSWENSELVTGDLIDTVRPAGAGAGKRLFDGIDEAIRSELVDAKVSSVGNLQVTYALRQEG